MKIARFKTTLVDVLLATHFCPGYSRSIAGSESNCISLEQLPWNRPRFNESMRIAVGCSAIPDRAGTGFSFDKRTVKRFSD